MQAFNIFALLMGICLGYSLKDKKTVYKIGVHEIKFDSNGDEKSSGTLCVTFKTDTTPVGCYISKMR